MSVNPDPKLSPYPQLFPEADSNQSLYPTLPAPLPQATVPLSSQGNTLTSMNPKLPDTKKGGNFFSFVKNSLFSKPSSKEKSINELFDAVEKAAVKAKIQDYANQNSQICLALKSIVNAALGASATTFEDRLDGLKNHLNDILQRPKVQTLDPALKTTLSNNVLNSFFEALLIEQAPFYSQHLAQYFSLPPDCINHIKGWYDLVSSKLGIAPDFDGVRKQMLEKAFGSPQVIAAQMDAIYDQIQSRLNDHDFCNSQHNIWKNLAWVYTNISEGPLPFNPNTFAKILVPSAPPSLELEEDFIDLGPKNPNPVQQQTAAPQTVPVQQNAPIQQPPAPVQQKPPVQVVAQPAPAIKIKKPVSFTLNQGSDYRYLPILKQREVVENIVEYRRGETENKVLAYLEESARKAASKQGVRFPNVSNCANDELVNVKSRYNDIKTAHFQMGLNISLLVGQKPEHELKKMIHEYLAAGRGNGIFDCGAFYGKIYFKALENNVKMDKDSQWGEHHVADSIEIFKQAHAETLNNECYL